MDGNKRGGRDVRAAVELSRDRAEKPRLLAGYNELLDGAAYGSDVWGGDLLSLKLSRMILGV